MNNDKKSYFWLIWLIFFSIKINKTSYAEGNKYRKVCDLFAPLWLKSSTERIPFRWFLFSTHDFICKLNMLVVWRSRWQLKSQKIGKYFVKKSQSGIMLRGSSKHFCTDYMLQASLLVLALFWEIVSHFCATCYFSDNNPTARDTFKTARSNNRNK